MTIIKYSMTAIECDETGETGFKLDGIPAIQGAFMVTTDSILIAHDILEHQNGLNKIGSIDDELEALGGMWFIRGENGMIRANSYHSNAVHLESDLINLGRIFIEQGVEFRTEIPVNPDNFYSILEDGEIDFMMAELYEKLKQECDIGEDSDTSDFERLNTYFQAIAPYLEQGYNKASERFSSWGHANNLFYSIEQELAPHIEPEYLGQVIEFTVDYDSNTVEILEPEYEEDEDY